MTSKPTTKRREAGFTLIELLVVVLIIGILAAIAIPQYFKVVERSRITEGQAFASAIKAAQERYLARNGVYAVANTDLTSLDIIFSGPSPNFGMKNFSVVMGAGAGCAGAPGYNIEIDRVTVNTNVASRYSTYGYLYERCSDAYFWLTCSACIVDFAQ